MIGQKISYNIRHDDLMDFADRIINKVKEEERKHLQEASDHGLLTRAEVKELFHVCDSTPLPSGQPRNTWFLSV